MHQSAPIHTEGPLASPAQAALEPDEQQPGEHQPDPDRAKFGSQRLYAPVYRAGLRHHQEGEQDGQQAGF